MLRTATCLTVLIGIILLPTITHAQASITGLAKDASGAVLPGVTVEASSPALIEKARTVITGEAGRYRIELLPPGTYTVTFTLPGFTTVRREGVELSGSFTATIDAELRVGGVEEAITVTAESPVVDVQAATHQRVVNRELIDTLPVGRTVFAQMALVPGATQSTATNQDVGGATNLSGAVTLQIHGSTQNSETLLTSQPSGWVPQGTGALGTTAYGSPISAINPFCRTSEPATQFKMLAVYTIPKIAVQLSSTFQNLPGPEILANYTATNSIIIPSLGRGLAGGATNVVVNMVQPGKMFGDRLTQLELRFGKILRLGERAKATLYMDIYNVLNVDTPLTLNNAYASWQTPQAILLARFAKPGLRIDF